MRCNRCNRRFYYLSFIFSIPAQLNNKNVIQISASAFENTNGINYTVEDGIVNIESRAFANCNRMEQIYIPDSVRYIAPNAFENCKNLVSIHVSENNLFYKSIDGILYTKNLAKILLYPAGKQGTEFYLDNTTHTIEKAAFAGQQYIQNIYLNKVSEIRDMAFKEANSLQNILNHDNINKVGADVFTGTKWLDNATANLILGNVFIKYYESNGSSYTLPESITSIASHAFDSATFNNINFSNNLNFIGSYAFNNCVNLEKILIPRNVITIDDNAFANCINLHEVAVLNLIPPVLGADVFINNAKNRLFYIPSLLIPDYEENINWDIYSNSFDVKKITIHFDSNGATANFDNIEVDYYSFISNLPYISRTNYLFRGWFLENQLIVDGSLLDVFEESIVLKVKWDPKNYQLRYSIRNGTNDSRNATQYNVENEIKLFDPLPHDGYAFGGWYLFVLYR